MSRESKRVITVDGFEHRLMIKAIYEYRNTLLREGKPTEDINDLTLKVINAPCRRAVCHEAR